MYLNYPRGKKITRANILLSFKARLQIEKPDFIT